MSIYWVLVVVWLGPYGPETKAIYGFKTEDACVEAANMIFKNTKNHVLCMEDNQP